MNVDFTQLPMPPASTLEWMREQGVARQTQFEIMIKVAPVEFLDNRRFEIDMEGAPAFVVEVPDAVWRPVDWLAWPMRAPERWAVLDGLSWCLGEPALIDAATYFDGGALKVVRTPIDWLRAGGHALMILRPELAWLGLGHCPRLAAQDAAHGRELERLLRPPKPTTEIMVPRPAARLAA